MLGLQGAARAAACTDLVPTARARGCSAAQWETARVASASLLGKALGSVCREWIADQIGRSVTRVEEWFSLRRRAAAPPLALLIAQRADGGGFVLDDVELEHMFLEVRDYRRRIGTVAAAHGGAR